MQCHTWTIAGVSDPLRSHCDCKRLFDIDGVSSHNAPPKRDVCPDHPEARVIKVRVEEQVSVGAVDWPAVQAVLAAHSGSIRVKHTLRPLGVAMAGRDVQDPYKD